MKPYFLSLFFFFLLIITDAEAKPDFTVLVFSKTAAYRHLSIEAGVAAIKKLGSEHNFLVKWTEDAAVFTKDSLDAVDVIIFLSTTGDILTDKQQTAMENFIKAGKGFVGIHSATDTEYDWEWYGKLVGRYFNGHPAIQHATVKKYGSDALLAGLDSIWHRNDEWYNFKEALVNDLHVILTVDETSYMGGKMGNFHPVAWYHEFDGGRSFYTAMGHTTESFTEETYLAHILAGITWAAPAPQDPDTTGTDTTITAIEKNMPEPELIIYPNPSGGRIFIDKSGNINQATMTDANGRIIYNSASKPENIDISKYPKGTYYLMFYQNKKKMVKKIIKNE